MSIGMSNAQQLFSSQLMVIVVVVWIPQYGVLFIVRTQTHIQGNGQKGNGHDKDHRQDDQKGARRFGVFNLISSSTKRPSGGLIFATMTANITTRPRRQLKDDVIVQAMQKGTQSPENNIAIGHIQGRQVVIQILLHARSGRIRFEFDIFSIIILVAKNKGDIYEAGNGQSNQDTAQKGSRAQLPPKRMQGMMTTHAKEGMIVGHILPPICMIRMAG